MKLDEFRATAISGNDISSSVLYVVGRCFIFAGKLAPFSLLLVVMVLYLFRAIYTEVVTALPLNGGAFNALLNTTTKFLAAMAGGLTLLSYAATAVVSANSAASYLNALVDELPVYWFTIVILFIFCVVTFMGMTESANVAITMFAFHLITLFLLAIACLYHVFFVPEIIQANWKLQGPIYSNYGADLYYGFCAALLGVSGFESSANFIEEQRPGVFSKTLINMWGVVAIVNPLMAMLAMAVLPYITIVENSNSLLSMMGQVSAGTWLKIIVTVDATIVLCGAVLTGYVGVTGLAHRMTLDRCLPQFLLGRNRWRGSLQWIIFGFFILTTSLFVIVNGNVSILDGVYAIAFLCVMALFSVGNMVLKYKRNRLPREARAPWWTVFVAFGAVVAGAIGTVISNIDTLVYFAIYFGITAFIIIIMLQRAFVLKLMLYFISSTWLRRYLSDWIQDQVRELKKASCVFFAKTGDVAVLNKAILYVRDNELTSRIRFVHIYSDEMPIPPEAVSTFRLDYGNEPAGPVHFDHDQDYDALIAENEQQPEHVLSHPGANLGSGDDELSQSAATDVLHDPSSSSDSDSSDSDELDPLDQALKARLSIDVLPPKQPKQREHKPELPSFQDPGDMRKQLMQDVFFLDRLYPKIRIDLVLVQGVFNPASVKYISEQLNIPPNFMFLSAPGNKFPYNLSDLGGVRLITH